MKKTVLCFIVLMSFCLLAGELVPIRQYDKLENFHATMIPDHYLFSAMGRLLALGFFDDSEEAFLNNFHKELSLPQQYHLANVLRILKDDKRINEFLIPSYNAARNHTGEQEFDENLNEKIYRVWRDFLKNLENDIHKIDDFYNYVCKVVNACDKNTSENGQLYIADMLDFATHKKMEHASSEEKNRIMQFIVDAINNKLTSNDAKTRLTLQFTRYMNEEQVRALNTTEYALILSIYAILNHGKFLDFSGIYYELIQNLKDYNFDDMWTTDEFCDHVPLKKWKSPQEAVDFIYKNREHLKFDNEKKIYIWK